MCNLHEHMDRDEAARATGAPDAHAFALDLVTPVVVLPVTPVQEELGRAA